MLRLPSSLSNYDIVHPAGIGTFSNVFCAVHNPSGLNVAIKVISKSAKTGKQPIETEILLLKRLKHPFITKIFEFAEDENNYYIVMEYAEGGNLLQHVNLHGPMNTEQLRKLILQLSSVLDYIENYAGSIVHRDIKTENILLDKYNNIRLADFGLAAESSGLQLTSPAGSPQYIAPEIIRGQNYGKPVDIWSTGIVLYCCATGRFPFFSTNSKGIMVSILSDEIQFPFKIDKELEDLIRQMLIKDQKKRIDINGILNHPFLKGHSLLNGQKNFNYNMHNYSEETKSVEEMIIQRNIETEMNAEFGILDNRNLSKIETDEYRNTVKKVQKDISRKTKKKDPMSFLAKQIVSKKAVKK